MSFKKVLFLAIIVAAFLIGTVLNFFQEQKVPPQKAAAEQNLKILVSIKPLYSLVLGLTKNVPKVQTELLLPPSQSPHTFHLKPSDVEKIVESDLVIWVGPELENFLINPLTNLKKKNQLITLFETAAVQRLNVREDAQWQPHSHAHEGHNHEHGDDEHEHDHAHSNMDGHIWLNTQNAKQIVSTVSKALQKRDPMHRSIYVKNTNRLLKDLDKLHAEIKRNLHGTQNKPFLVFHDAYQYFEKEFGLKGSGSITLNPQIPLSAKRLKTLQTSIEKQKIRCIFSEPEFSQNLVQKLVSNTNIKSFELDPLGARIIMQPGEEEAFYFDLMRGLGHSFKACLIE